jgi:hypothetical protein
MEWFVSKKLDDPFMPPDVQLPTSIRQKLVTVLADICNVLSQSMDSDQACKKEKTGRIKRER